MDIFLLVPTSECRIEGSRRSRSRSWQRYQQSSHRKANSTTQVHPTNPERSSSVVPSRACIWQSRGEWRHSSGAVPRRQRNGVVQLRLCIAQTPQVLEKSGHFWPRKLLTWKYGRSTSLLLPALLYWTSRMYWHAVCIAWGNGKRSLPCKKKSSNQ